MAKQTKPKVEGKVKIRVLQHVIENGQLKYPPGVREVEKTEAKELFKKKLANPYTDEKVQKAAGRPAKVETR